MDEIRGKPWQSKLTPYYDEIYVLRKEKVSYAKIAEILNKKHGMKVSSATVFKFVKARTNPKPVKYELPPLNVSEIHQNIEEKKQESSRPKEERKNTEKRSPRAEYLAKLEAEKKEKEEADKNKFVIDTTKPAERIKEEEK